MARALSIQLPNTLSELSPLLDKVQRRLSNQLLVSGALAIKAGGSALAKIGAAIHYMVDGSLATKAINTDMAALAGTVANAKFNVFVFSITAAGTPVTQMGTAASTLAGVVFPTVADGSAVIGFVIINPTGTGDFVGGTTALDNATVVPNAVYVNTPYPFIPGMELF